MTRRTFATVWATAAGASVAPFLTAGDALASAVTRSDAEIGGEGHDAQSLVPGAESDKLQSEFLLDLMFDKGPSNDIGVNRFVVPILAGTFDGPKLKGTVVSPAGDWMVRRADGSSVLDLRLLLQTDDAQKIYMTGHGVAYTQPGGALFARILPLFETGAAKYGWLNNVVAVGVFRPIPGKVAYRLYQIL